MVAERETPVRLSFTPAAMHIEAGTGDEAAYAEDIPAGLDGEPIPVAFRPRFLLDALAMSAVTATGADTVRLALTGRAGPRSSPPPSRADRWPAVTS